jgi:hypothetical protein
LHKKAAVFKTAAKSFVDFCSPGRNTNRNFFFYPPFFLKKSGGNPPPLEKGKNKSPTYLLTLRKGKERKRGKKEGERII